MDIQEMKALATLAATNWQAEMNVPTSDISRLIDRLEKAESELRKANEYSEKFERQMYMEMDRAEKAEARLDELVSQDPEKQVKPELHKVIYHFRDCNEGFPVERFKADYVISWMLANYPPAPPVPFVVNEIEWKFIRFTDLGKNQRMKCNIAWTDGYNSVIYDEEGATQLLANWAFEVLEGIADE